MSDVVSEVQQSCVFMLQHAKRLHKLYFHENKKAKSTDVKSGVPENSELGLLSNL
jgi:hypothetical protein